MALSSPAKRELIHTRTVECNGYRRKDGLWDIEGRLVDIKTYTFHNNERGEVPPGEPVHEMWIRLTVDDDLKIHDVEAKYYADSEDAFDMRKYFPKSKKSKREAEQLPKPPPPLSESADANLSSGGAGGDSVTDRHAFDGEHEV